ncbi:hypothetical protein [Dubosiella newyorkensis]|uniref:hypothetical protein n=2 Tax=Dubosiella newyorkensis TaxID=1862672 RepID=UPI00272A99F5|nr:hypothetical protein [Dubosiella newyorkensis]
MNEDEFSRFVQYYRIDFDPNILCIQKPKEQIRKFFDALYERNYSTMKKIREDQAKTYGERVNLGLFHNKLLSFIVSVPFFSENQKKWKSDFEKIEINKEVYDDYELAIFYCMAGYDQIWNLKGQEAQVLLGEALRYARLSDSLKVEALSLLWLGQFAIDEKNLFEGLRLTRKAKDLFFESHQFNRIIDAEIQTACFLEKMNQYAEALSLLDRLENSAKIKPNQEIVNQRIWIAFQQREYEKACRLIEENRTPDTILDGNFGLLPMGYFLLRKKEKAMEQLIVMLPYAKDPWTKAGLNLVVDLVRDRRKNIHRTLKTLKHQSELRRKQDIYQFLLGCVIRSRQESIQKADLNALRELVEWQKEWIEIESGH